MSHSPISRSRHPGCVCLTLGLLLASISSLAVTAEEHAKHHPGATAGSSGSGAGTGTEMAKMMEGCCGGKPKTKEFYPSLMDLPKLTEKQKADLQTRAHDRMKAGASIMNRGIEDLTRAAQADDYVQMERASAKIREGLAEFDSGVSTHRALLEGKTPQEIALDWFKHNLNLEEREPIESRRGFFGISAFHLFLMIFLIAFTLIVIGMYFFKMRRAAQLLRRIGGESPPRTPGEPPISPPPSPGGTTLGQAPSPHVPQPPQRHAGPAQGVPSRWKGQLEVAKIFSETPNVKTFRLANPTHAELPFTYQAGQFLTLGVTIEGKPAKRAYSISSHPCEHDALDLTIKREDHGLVSRFMHDVVKEGDILDVEAAYGNLTFYGLGNQPLVLIGGGVGITPLMSVLRCMISCGMENPIYLLYACKSISDFVFREELEFLRERHPNLKLLVAVNHLEGEFPWAYEGRLTKEKIIESVPEIANSRIHLCGPPPMMQAMRTALGELGVSQDQIKTEAFGPTATPPQAPLSKADLKEPTPILEHFPTVTFTRSGKSAPIPPDKSVLEVSEQIGVDIPWVCRVGICGTCKVKLISGEVFMEVQEALTGEDKKHGIILACQAKTTKNIQIEEP